MKKTEYENIVLIALPPKLEQQKILSGSVTYNQPNIPNQFQW